jgi:hypothetical protein
LLGKPKEKLLILFTEPYSPPFIRSLKRFVMVRDALVWCTQRDRRTLPQVRFTQLSTEELLEIIEDET